MPRTYHHSTWLSLGGDPPSWEGDVELAYEVSPGSPETYGLIGFCDHRQAVRQLPLEQVAILPPRASRPHAHQTTDMPEEVLRSVMARSPRVMDNPCMVTKRNRPSKKTYSCANVKVFTVKVKSLIETAHTSIGFSSKDQKHACHPCRVA